MIMSKLAVEIYRAKILHLIDRNPKLAATIVSEWLAEIKNTDSKTNIASEAKKPKKKLL